MFRFFSQSKVGYNSRKKWYIGMKLRLLGAHFNKENLKLKKKSENGVMTTKCDVIFDFVDFTGFWDTGSLILVVHPVKTYLQVLYLKERPQKT